MKSYFEEKLKYNLWANERTVESLLSIEGKCEKAFQLMSHILIAELNWLYRLTEPKKFRTNLWEIYSIDEIKRKTKESYDSWLNYLTNSNEKTLGLLIVYKTSAGDKYSNSPEQIITHLLNHSTYHRGQIALLVKSEGAVPAVTDYIVFIR